MPQRIRRRKRTLVSADPSAGSGLPAVFRAHTPVLRHGRIGIDRHRDSRLGDHSQGAKLRSALCVLGCTGRAVHRLFSTRNRCDFCGHCGADVNVLVHQGRPGNADYLPARTGRRRTPCGSGGDRLCAGGRDHRYSFAHGRRLDLCRLHIGHWPGQPAVVTDTDNGHLPGAGHGHSDHTQLHHHQFDRSTCPVGTGCTADRVAHVRVLFRHPRRPDTTGRPRLLCRSPHRKRKRIQDQPVGSAHCAGRFRHSVHGCL
ncbi:hypothetical protein D3C75_807570 [compost metagenome]